MPNSWRRRSSRLAALGLAALAFAPAAQAGPRTYKIALAQMAFGPVPSGLHVGDTIVWVNKDVFQHTATARDHSFDVDLPPKASKRVLLRRPGTIVFYCRYHPGMTGKLVVAK